MSLESGGLTGVITALQRFSDSSFFESDSSPDPRDRNPDPDPNPVFNRTMKSESCKNPVYMLD